MPFKAERDHVGHKIDALYLCAIYQKSLKLDCRRCGHRSILPGVSVWWLFEQRRWDLELRNACRRFYCSACWATRGQRVRDPNVTTTDEKPTADPFGWPDERTWKALVRRFKS
jgi:ribosomal protein L37E